MLISKYYIVFCSKVLRIPILICFQFGLFQACFCQINSGLGVEVEGMFKGGPIVNLQEFSAHIQSLDPFPSFYLRLKNNKATMFVSESSYLLHDQPKLIWKYRGRYSVDSVQVIIHFHKVKNCSRHSGLTLRSTRKLNKSDEYSSLKLSIGFVSDTRILHLSDSTTRIQFTHSPLNRKQFKKSVK